MGKKKISKITDLHFDKQNINKGSVFGSALLNKSLQEVGAGRSVLADKNGVLIAGNKTVEQFTQAGMSKIHVVETTGDTLVVVQRTDLDINTTEGAKMKVLDNTVSKHNYIEDADVALVICEEYNLKPAELGLEVGASDNGYNTEFSLPDGDKQPFQQMTFTLADAQAARIKKALSVVKIKDGSTYGNENTNGNSLHQIILEWEERKIL